MRVTKLGGSNFWPDCAIWYAEGRLKTNDPAELKEENSREICAPDAIVRSDDGPERRHFTYGP